MALPEAGGESGGLTVDIEMGGVAEGGDAEGGDAGAVYLPDRWHEPEIFRAAGVKEQYDWVTTQF